MTGGLKMTHPPKAACRWFLAISPQEPLSRQPLEGGKWIQWHTAAACVKSDNAHVLNQNGAPLLKRGVAMVMSVCRESFSAQPARTIAVLQKKYSYGKMRLCCKGGAWGKPWRHDCRVALVWWPTLGQPMAEGWRRWQGPGCCWAENGAHVTALLRTKEAMTGADCLLAQRDWACILHRGFAER